VKKKFLVVLVPHFAPDTAPTGEVISTLVDEFVAAGQRVHVVTALPWYRNHCVEPGWTGRLIRRETTSWGSIIRVHPFAGKDKKNLLRRAVGFLLFSVLAGMCALCAGGIHRRPQAVISMSPPLTLGLTGWLAARLRRAPCIFNIQDVFPDAAITTGAITNTKIITVARWLERVSYHRSDAVVVLSEDLQKNVVAKISPRHQPKVHVIPNFVDAERIVPMDRMTRYRTELGIGNETVVMYAGNVGFSQSLTMMLDAAKVMTDVAFVINGDGAARDELIRAAHEVPNMYFSGYQPRQRVPEVLASGDIHVVLLKAGLGAVSVPSKTYSILAAARPVVAAIDSDTEVTRILAASGAGTVVQPDDAEQFIAALQAMNEDLEASRRMGQSGRQWVQSHVSPTVVARSYLDLCNSLGR
jgi:colanic acid biosynthesis glycosyl transferase WcaI